MGARSGSDRRTMSPVVAGGDEDRFGPTDSGRTVIATA